MRETEDERPSGIRTEHSAALAVAHDDMHDSAHGDFQAVAAQAVFDTAGLRSQRCHLLEAP